MNDDRFALAKKQDEAKAVSDCVFALAEREERLLAHLTAVSGEGDKRGGAGNSVGNAAAFAELSLKAEYLQSEIAKEISRLELDGNLAATQQVAVLKQMAERISSMRETIAHAKSGLSMARKMGDAADENERLATFARNLAESVGTAGDTPDEAEKLAAFAKICEEESGT